VAYSKLELNRLELIQ